MSVVINTNYAATIASDNLAASSRYLQRSLNRLASGSKIINPSDDAGGLAVSMKLTATARRQSAASANLGNAASFLQTQDGALQTAGKVLTRISELKTLYADPTKNDADLANYQAEFSQLQAQLLSIGAERFNGKSLFTPANLSIGATADPSGAEISFGAADLFGVGGSGWNNVGMTPSDWSITGADIEFDPISTTKNIVQAGDSSIAFHNSGAGSIQTAQNNITGPFTLSFTTSSSVPNIYQDVSITAGGATLNLTPLLGSSADHRVEIVDDGVNARISIDGGAATVMGTLTSGSGGPLTISTAGHGGNIMDGDVHLTSLSLVNTGGGSAYNDVANGASLGDVSLDRITQAIQEIATFRATNGAEQSRLQFADEVLRVNKANIEAANSRITDVDVAQESTQLARYNILVQSGAAMLTQANQSAQMALRLLG